VAEIKRPTREVVDGLDLCFAVVSAILERRHNGQIEILMQTRWKPDRDPAYSGTLEIPAGGIKRYENVYDALRREVFEETGLRVLNIKPDLQTPVCSRGDDGAFAFVPFCAQQQTSGGLSRIGLVFVCEVEDKTPVAKPDESKDIVWMTRPALKQLIEKTPEKVFTFQLAALRFYLRQTEESD
jgi:8-oxo-dGTP pyrophosphatase MutT (NUDIX family)